MGVYTLQFADDQIIIANDKDDIEYMTKKLQEEYKLWGLEINTQKTKYLPIGAEPSNIKIGTDEIEACDRYTYLGVEFDTTGKNDSEIKKRITHAMISEKGGNIIYTKVSLNQLYYMVQRPRHNKEEQKKT